MALRRIVRYTCDNKGCGRTVREDEPEYLDTFRIGVVPSRAIMPTEVFACSEKCVPGASASVFESEEKPIRKRR